MKIKVEEEEVFMRMPKVLKKEFHELAVREGRTMKEIIIEVIAEYVKVHKNGNPQHLITSWQENENFGGFSSLGVDYKTKKAYIQKNLMTDGKLNKLGKETWGHICQWYEEMKKL